MEHTKFDDLPILESLKLRHSWGLFKDGDIIGTLNRQDESARIRGASTIRTGKLISLDLPLNLPSPPMYGREPFHHEVFATSRNDWDDRLDGFFPQGSTQWDSLRHVRCREFGFYGGRVTALDASPAEIGIQGYAEHGIVGRGVLLDIARYFQEGDRELNLDSPYSITAQDLVEVANSQKITFEMGDILCVRTGWVGRYLNSDQASRNRMSQEMSFPGLAADEQMARQLWDWGLSAIVMDNPAIEVSPGDPLVGSLHRRLIPTLGFALGEFFQLDELADECVRNNRTTFFFCSVPMKVPGGVGSPGNAIAIF